MKKINSTNLKRLQIPVPKPQVQDAIEKETEAIRAARDSVSRRISESISLRRSLLNQVLSQATPNSA